MLDRRPAFLRTAIIAVIVLLHPVAASAMPAGFDPVLLDRTVERARSLDRLNTLIVARDGVVAVERAFRGPAPDTPVNVKSVAKSVVSALVGAAIARELLAGPDQPIGELFGTTIPKGADPAVAKVTVGNLLSMQSGLDRTSGRNYGRWVTSPDWVAYALSRPFVDAPGGRMLYSTGNFHLLSAVLSRASGRDTHALAREWLGEPLNVRIPEWDRDPQGIYFGGNNMLLSPRALLRFGELYRRGGEIDGRRVLPESWIAASWKPRTRSPFSGDAYGYGWFLRDVGGHMAAYARGFGGQFVIVVPSLEMTVVITSDTTTRLRVDGYGDALWSLVSDGLVPAAQRANLR